jgi:hypothetical protein
VALFPVWLVSLIVLISIFFKTVVRWNSVPSRARRLRLTAALVALFADVLSLLFSVLA